MRTEEKLNLRSRLDAGSYAALFILLVGRLPLTDPTILHGILGLDPFPPWAQLLVSAHGLLGHIYSHAGLLVLAIVLLLQRADLGRLKGDAAFPFIFIWATFAFSLANPGPVGWAAAVLAVSLPLLLRKDSHRIVRLQPAAWRAVSGSLIALCLCLILVRSILDPGMIRSAIHWILIDFPPNAAIEEIVFRGLLWMCLKSLGWADGPVVVLQATLFWLAHAYYLSTDPAGFWVIVPVLSLVLGVIVWRTSSLTAGTIAHICMNAGWSLILYAMK